MKQEVVLRKIQPEDLLHVVAVHINSFPESALTRLGAQIVRRYYLWQLTGPHKKVWATGAYVGDDCAGFSFSGIYNGSTSGFIQQNKRFLVKEVLLRPWLLFNPLFMKRLGEGVKLIRCYSKKRSPKITVAGQLQMTDYGILSIAVADKYQKSGIGQMLMLDAEKEARKYGYRQICLTVHPDNTKAVRFYEKQNWQKFYQSDSWNGAMIKSLQ
jgi:ribosomal protein S18 acetylase RimI-like enzyme